MLVTRSLDAKLDTSLPRHRPPSLSVSHTIFLPLFSTLAVSRVVRAASTSRHIEELHLCLIHEERLTFEVRAIH
jgi:hypothetical protein